MSAPSFSADFYADWVFTQIAGGRSPSAWLIDHRNGWANTFAKMVEGSAVFELPALVISRWEFLGSLFRGNTHGTGCEDAVTYAKKFLVPVNPAYAGVHNLVARPADQQNANQSDIFQMFRNRPLHSVHSMALTLPNNSGLIGWMLDVKPTGGVHLVLNPDGNVHIDGSRLAAELLDSMTLFATYLEENRLGERGVDARLPRDRWLRAHWARYKPHGGTLGLLANWMALGHRRGVSE